MIFNSLPAHCRKIVGKLNRKLKCLYINTDDRYSSEWIIMGRIIKVTQSEVLSSEFAHFQVMERWKQRFLVPQKMVSLCWLKCQKNLYSPEQTSQLGFSKLGMWCISHQLVPDVLRTGTFVLMKGCHLPKAVTGLFTSFR